MAEVQELKAQIMEMNAAMIEQAANMKILTDLVAKLTAPASAQAPAPAPQPAPAAQPEPPDHWATGWQQHQAGIAVAQPGQTAPPLRPIHPKDIEKPEKYDLTGDGWLEWSRHFVRFLDRNDAPHYRWAALLKSIEGLKGKPVTASDEATWAADLELGAIGEWKSQLETYLCSYTKGRAREIIRHAGTAGALDAWRILADKGHSQRPMHQQALRTKAYGPRTGVPAKDLELAIMRWETDVRLFEQACAPEVMSEPNRRMFLENMCPDKLRDHLSAQGPLRYPTGDSLRTEISDWVQKELERGSKAPKAAALEPHWPDSPTEEGSVDYEEADGADLVAQIGLSSMHIHSSMPYLQRSARS